MRMDHDWDHANALCRNCGLSTQDYLNTSEWFVLFCTGKKDQPQISYGRCTCGAKAVRQDYPHSEWCDSSVDLHKRNGGK